MTLHIGIDYQPDQWRVCIIGHNEAPELHTLGTAREVLTAISAVCTRGAIPTLIVSLDVTTPFLSMQSMNDGQLDRLVQRYHPTPMASEVSEVLQELRAMHIHSYCAPSVEYLPTLPAHRRLMRPTLGTANELCALLALLQHMREQEAIWQEMNFLYVNASSTGVCILVIKGGQVVNGIGTVQGSSFSAASGYLEMLETADDLGEQEQRAHLQRAFREAFWEGLTQELAGLMAIHHIEDIVVLGQRSGDLVERLAGVYQIYYFPYARTEREGYEAASGAALMAEGLEHTGSAAEVVQHLQIRHASRLTLVN